MTQPLPEPLVPADVDLRDFDFIPLYGDRLFNSDTWALCDADEKVAALRLWWRAWHEEPAGSLPNNDRLLAERAGYGVAVKAFLAVKPNAMRGWILCSDDRLYHPVVASIALDVWEKKSRKRVENDADRERKRLKRAALSSGQPPSVRRTNGHHPADGDENPPDDGPDKDAIPPDVQSESALKGREGEEKKEERASAPPTAIWFEGGALKLNRRDFEAWQIRFAEAYPNLWEELARIDPKLVLKGIFGSDAYLTTENWLNAGLIRWRKQRVPPNAEHLQVAS